MPDSRRRSPQTASRSVVLPQPVLPMSTPYWPVGTSSVTLRSANAPWRMLTSGERNHGGVFSLYQSIPVPRSPNSRAATSTTSAVTTIISETAAAASMLPVLSSRKTDVGKTSVRMRVAPEKTRIGPNSPKRAGPGQGGRREDAAAGLRHGDHPEGLPAAAPQRQGHAFAAGVDLVEGDPHRPHGKGAGHGELGQHHAGHGEGHRHDPLDRPAQRRLVKRINSASPSTSGGRTMGMSSTASTRFLPGKR